jgi:tetratricopeptide (TPR) repeat protein
MPAPKTNTDEITSRIEALSKRKEVLPFEVKYLQREIGKLIATYPAEAFMLSGMLAGMTGNRSEAKSQHEKSLSLEYEVVGVYNYGVSMKKVGELSLAKSLFAKSLAMSPGDWEIFDHQLQTYCFLLDYRDFEALVSVMQKARPEENLAEHPDVIMTREHLNSLEQLGISLEEYSRFGLHAEQALLKFDLHAHRVSESVSSFDGVPHMFVEYHVESNSADVLFEVNELLVDLIMEDDALHSWDKVILSICRADQGYPERDGTERTAA